jgi:hypothetical protein
MAVCAEKIANAADRGLESGEIGQDDLRDAALALITRMDAAAAHALIAQVTDLLVKAAPLKQAA